MFVIKERLYAHPVHFNTTVWLISWTPEVKAKLLSKQKHYIAHKANVSNHPPTWCIKRFKRNIHINLNYALHYNF